MKQKLITFALRFHLFWVLFYMLLVGSAFAYASHLYVQYDRDQLPNGTIELVTDKEQYQLGEEIEFTVHNHFPTTVYITNHCPNEPLHVFRWVDEAWLQLHDIATSENSACYGQERNVAISSESSRSYTFNDWPNLFTEPGVYRIAMEVDHYNDIPFQDFVILEPQEVVQVKEEPTYIYRQQPTPPPPVVEIVEEEPLEEEIIEEVYYEEEEEDEYEEEDEHEEREDDEHEEDDD